MLKFHKVNHYDSKQDKLLYIFIDNTKLGVLLKVIKRCLIHKLYNFIRCTDYKLMLVIPYPTLTQVELTCTNIFKQFRCIRSPPSRSYKKLDNFECDGKLIVFTTYWLNIFKSTDKIISVVTYKTESNDSSNISFLYPEDLYDTNYDKFYNCVTDSLFPINKEVNKYQISTDGDGTVTDSLEVAEAIYNCLDDNVTHYYELKQMVSNLYKINDDAVRDVCHMIYQKLKILSNSLREQKLSKIKSNSFVEFAKKTVEDNRRLNEFVFKNTKVVEDLNTISDIIEQTEFKQFFEQIDDPEFERSRECFMSPITLSDWTDELQLGSCIGLLVNIKSTEQVKFGYNNKYEFDATTTFMPIEDYMETVDLYFKKNSLVNYGDLNSSNIFTGRGIGTGNVVIPMYINKHHWKIAKLYMIPMLGVGFCHNPLLGRESHLKLMFSMFVQFIKNSFTEAVSCKSVETLFAFMRTCSEIAFEKGYSRGVRKYITKFLEDPKTDYETIVGQSLASGYFVPTDTVVELIRQFIKQVIKQNCKISTSDLESDLDNTVYNVEYKINEHLKIFKSYYLFNNILGDTVKQIGSFNKLIKMLDQSGGVVPESLLNMITPLIKENSFNTISFIELYETMKMDKWKDDVIKLIYENNTQ